MIFFDFYGKYYIFISIPNKNYYVYHRYYVCQSILIMLRIVFILSKNKENSPIFSVENSLYKIIIYIVSRKMFHIKRLYFLKYLIVDFLEKINYRYYLKYERLRFLIIVFHLSRNHIALGF